MKTMRKVSELVGATALLAVAGACDLTVTNPGPIEDAALDVPAAMPGLVTGMSADLSVALNSIVANTAVMGDDLGHSGNYFAQGLFYRGIINPEDVNGLWGNMHRARWAAESGLDRMRDVLGGDFEASPLSARAYLLAGFANRMLGETVCEAVFEDGGALPHSTHFERAEDHFTASAIIAERVDAQDLAWASYGGRAAVRAAQNDWEGAREDASRVPLDFLYEASFSLNTGRENNNLAFETQTRAEYTVHNTPWADVHGDPRVPWDSTYTGGGELQTGADGHTPFLQQQKYPTLGDNIPLTKGTEMLLIRAEAALRSGEIESAEELINEGREYVGLTTVSVSNEAEAWELLRSERGAVLWLEGRRLWDLRRWYADDGPAHVDFLADRDRCIPISANERLSNPNL